MYTAYYGDQLLFDPRDQDRQLYGQECGITLNEACSYTFSMPTTHPLAGRLTVMDRNNEVVLCSNNEIVFRGRVVSEETDFYGCPTYTCEGERAYLNDVTADKFWTYNDKDDGTTPEGVQVSPDLEDLFRYLVSAYNGRAGRAFAEGINQGAAIYSGTVNIQNTSRESVWKTIKSECVDAYGGYVRVRYDGGTAYIDYLAGGDHVCGQVVSFGNNLLDYVRTRDGSDICTRIIPVGQTAEVSHQEQKYDDEGNPEYDDEGNPEYETVIDVEAGQDVYISGYPDNPLSAGYSKAGDHVVWGEGEKTYGIIEKYVSYSDLSEPADLVSAALADLQKCVLGDTIDLSALDLSLLDATADRLTPGDYVRVTSEPHGLDCYLVCTAATLHPDAPDTDTYTLGLSRNELTQVQADRISQLNSTITLVEQVTTTGVQQATASATSASAVAVKAQAQAAAAAKTAGQAVTTANQAALDASAAMESAQSSADEAKAAKADAEAVKAEAAKIAEGAAAAAEAAEKAGQQAVTAASVEYATSASQTAAPTEGWSTSRPSHVSGEYTWTRTVFTNGAGASTTSEPALITGEDGAQGKDGAQGASVVGVTTFWQLAESQPDTPSGTADPEGWSTTAPEPAEGYTGSLWVTYRSVISDGVAEAATYTVPARDSSYAYAQRCWALEDGTYTTAAKLKQATDEVSSTLKADYSTSADVAKTYATQSSLAQTASSITSSVAEKYQEKGDYATNDGVATTLKEYSTVTQTAEAVEAKFSQAVTAVVTQYAAGSSATAAPTSGWSTATPTWSSGKYIWQRTVTTVNGKQTVGNATCIQGAKGEDGAQGEKGEDGAAGNGIKKATPQYYLSTSKTTATGGSWATAPQTYVAGRYYWTRTAYTWTASTATTYSTAVYDPSLTAALAGVTELETLVRATADGLEVAKMSDGSYVGTRAVLDSDSLDFVSQDGKTTYASFATDEVLLGMGSTSANIWLCKYSGQTGTVNTKGSFLLNKQSDGCHLYSDGLLTICPALAGTDSGWLSIGIGESSIAGGSQRVYLQGADGKKACMANILHVSSSYSGGYKVIYSTDLDEDQAKVSDSRIYRCVAFRLSGWVVVALNNYICPTSAPDNYVVGTLPAGWRPPMMMKGALFAGGASALGYDKISEVFADYGVMVNVTTEGQVRLYSPGLPADTKLSGYVIFPATK